MRLRFARLLTGLWWGSLSSLGFLFVPLLFKNLDTPAQAGAMAARLFTAQTWLSIVCALLALALLNKKDDDSLQRPAQAVTGLLVAGLLLAVLVEFAVAPQIVSARATGGSLRLWHGLGSGMYLLHWLCASLAFWRLSRS